MLTGFHVRTDVIFRMKTSFGVESCWGARAHGSPEINLNNLNNIVILGDHVLSQSFTAIYREIVEGDSRRRDPRKKYNTVQNISYINYTCECK